MSLTIKNDKLVWQDEEMVTIELLSSEISSRISSDDFLASSLSSALYSEVSLERSARISVVESLSTVCSNILGATTEYSLDTLSELASARVSGDASLSNDLSSEVSSRISGTTSIHNLFTTALELNDLLVQGNTNILGNLTVTETVTSVILNTLNVDIKDNLIGLNIGAAELSHNYKDTGIIYERGSEQKNIFSGFKENNDKYSIFYTSNNSDFSGNNLTNDGYVDLQVKNLEFFDGSCNSLVIQGTNVSVAISSETDARLSGDASLSTMFDLAGISLKNYGTENWTARDSSREWNSVSVGATGQYQAAVSYNNLYLSSNYGTTWTENTSAGSRNWNSIAISSNGQFITAIAGGDIYISINSGVNWTYTYKPFGRQYRSVCMSDNGQYQLVGGSNINPHVSYNYGYSWTPILYVYNWFVVGMSADGKYQFANSYESGLYYSVDYGANWNIMAEYPTGGVLKSISVSSTGQYVTVAEDSQIYISSNFGASWTQKETTKNWYSVAISGNGQIQLASLYNQGQIYISTDFGNTWVPKGTARIWRGGVAISSNGQYITGSVFNGQIYTYNSADSGLSSAITSLSTGLSTGLSSEISSRLSGDASLSIKLSEMAEGMSGDTTSSTELSSEVISRVSGDASLSNDLSLEFVARMSGDASLSTGLSSEISSRLSGDASLTTTVTGLSTGLSTEVISRVSGDASLTTTVTGLSTGLSSEISSRLSGDASLSIGLSTRISVDNSLTTTITTLSDTLDLNGLSLTGLELINYDNGVWTARDSSREWNSVSVGATGQYQAAVSYNLYLSSNYGASWTENTSSGVKNWKNVAISSNGQYITAVTGDRFICVSSNSGVTWEDKLPNSDYFSVCMSNNGQYQLAGSVSGVKVSNNYGVTWTTKTEGFSGWMMVYICMSADGKYQFGCNQESSIYISTNFGSDWAILAESPSASWSSISVSSTGQYVTAVANVVVNGGNIYISSNYGASWTQKETNRAWKSVSVSSSGQFQVAVADYIYISSDFGNTWVPKETNRDWTDVSISSNGKYVTGSVSVGQIYTYNSPDSGLSSVITSLSTGLSSEISSRLSGDASLSIKLSEMAEGMSGDTTSSTELSSEVSSIRSLLGRPPIMSYTTLPSYLPTQMGYYGTFTGDLPAIKTGVTPGNFTLLTSTGLTLQPGNYIFNFQICYSISNTGYISNIYAGLTTSNIAFVGSGNFYVIGSQYISSPQGFPVLYNVCRHLQVATETTFYLATSIMFSGSAMQILGSDNYATFLKVG